MSELADLLPDDFEGRDGILKAYPDVESLARGARGLRQQVSELGGENVVRIPGADAGDDAWQDVYRKMGRPEEPTGYEEFSLEGEGELATRINEAAFKSGLNVKQHKALASAVRESLATEDEKAATTIANLRAAWQEERAGQPEERIATAERYRNLVLEKRPDLAQALKDFGLEDLPILDEVFLAVADATGDDVLPKHYDRGKEPRVDQVEEAAKRIDELNAEMDEIKGKDPRDPRLSRMMDQLVDLMVPLVKAGFESVQEYRDHQHLTARREQLERSGVRT